MRSEQIEFFMSCAACLNFSLAAKYHFVSVSTLSRSISALEEEMGVQLFIRGYHGHELTKAGKAFFEACMSSSVDYEYFLSKWGRRPRELVYLGCKAYDGSYECLIKAYAEISMEKPALKFKLHIIPDDKILQCLKDGIIDYAVFEKGQEIDSMHSFPFIKAEEKEYLLVSMNDDINKLANISKM